MEKEVNEDERSNSKAKSATFISSQLKTIQAYSPKTKVKNEYNEGKKEKY